jgi:tRNA A37 methylthiotransferase MiaB
MSRRVALVTLGCARNEVDSEELAGRLAAGGWEVTAAADGAEVAGAAGADVVIVNTCGFIEQAKKDSVDTLLAAAEDGAVVVAAGCLAERYGAELAGSLPEAAAVLSFDDYPDIAGTLDRIAAGERPAAHTPRDRRRLPSTAGFWQHGGAPRRRGATAWQASSCRSATTTSS